MRKMMSKMWKDDAGIVAFEYLLVATIVGLALVIGLSAVSSAINAELVELANAILALNQGYSVAGQSACQSFKTGSAALDEASLTGFGNIPAPGASLISTGVTVCP